MNEIELIRKNEKYSHLITIETAQKKYGLDYLHCGDDFQCETPILTLTNKDNSDTTKTHVFLSGGVHGNERVAETAMIELVKMLLE